MPLRPACLAAVLALLPPAAATTASGSQWLIGDTLATRGDIIGDVVKLDADGDTLLALHQPGRRDGGRGAVLLLHAPGSNADDIATIRPLRLGLSAAGWDTLALQLPPVFISETTDQWLRRHNRLAAQISAGLAWLRQRGQLNQVLLGVGGSANAALALIANQAPREVQGLVLISMPLSNGQNDAENLAASKVPVLDLYAEYDRPGVIDAAPRKRRAAASLTSFRQRALPDAVPGFSRTAGNLVSQVRAWLARYADGRTLDASRK